MYVVCYVCVCVVYFLFGVFFFKQKTAYEMRISDWSSDVCSSDLTYGIRSARLGSSAYPFASPSSMHQRWDSPVVPKRGIFLQRSSRARSLGLIRLARNRRATCQSVPTSVCSAFASRPSRWRLEGLTIPITASREEERRVGK